MLLRSLKSKFIGFKLNLILLLLIIMYICGAQAFFYCKKGFLGKKSFALRTNLKSFFLKNIFLILRFYF